MKVAVGRPSVACTFGNGGASAGTGEISSHSSAGTTFSGATAGESGANGSDIRVDSEHGRDAQRRLILFEIEQERRKGDEIAPRIPGREVAP